MTQLQPFDPILTDLMTVSDFVEGVKDGHFTDYDGQGFYGTPDHYDMDAPARPSQILKGQTYNNGWSWVHWFNK
jgi:hypothetical protein